MALCRQKAQRCVVLETLEHAKARGAQILGELVGYAQSCDAVHVSAPDPEGHAVAYAIRRSLEKAGLTINDIDYINAHGTSTPLNDAQETKVIKMVFGEQAYNVPVSSTKSSDGPRHELVGIDSRRFSACWPSATASSRRRSTTRRPIPNATWTTCRIRRARRTCARHVQLVRVRRAERGDDPEEIGRTGRRNLTPYPLSARRGECAGCGDLG